MLARYLAQSVSKFTEMLAQILHHCMSVVVAGLLLLGALTLFLLVGVFVVGAVIVSAVVSRVLSVGSRWR